MQLRVGAAQCRLPVPVNSWRKAQTARAPARVSALTDRASLTNRPATAEAKLSHPLVALAAALLVYTESSGAAELPPSPPIGSCTDCIGEVNGTLNACTLTSPACISSQNEDEEHFVAPWQYNSSTDAAIDMLVAVATGNRAAPQLLQQDRHEPVPWTGTVIDRHTTADEEYVHMLFGARGYGEGENRNVVDAEFLFLKGDNIVDLRASSRLKPVRGDGQLSLSLAKGVVYDQNVAQRLLEQLRKALRWESVPVITGFDPRFNQDKPLFFEKLYQPFLRGRYKQSIVDDMQ